jgi:hypothetical protein
LGFRVASSHAGSSVQVYLDDDTTLVTLPAGQHRLILAFPTDYVNINWISFAPRG